MDTYSELNNHCGHMFEGIACGWERVDSDSGIAGLLGGISKSGTFFLSEPVLTSSAIHLLSFQNAFTNGNPIQKISRTRCVSRNKCSQQPSYQLPASCTEACDVEDATDPRSIIDLCSAAKKEYYLLTSPNILPLHLIPHLTCL